VQAINAKIAIIAKIENAFQWFLLEACVMTAFPKWN
jgi:hypothetical protein